MSVTNKFDGDIEGLKAVVANTGIPGEWKEIDHGFQFRSKSGPSLVGISPPAQFSSKVQSKAEKNYNGSLMLVGRRIQRRCHRQP
jgi:hypothetical protein